MVRRSADERRELLIEAAIRVMTRDGVAKATTRAIVADAGMQLGMFHYCFRSKQELLERVIEAITTHSLERADGLPQIGESVEETVRATMQMYWDHVVANPDEHLLTYELTQYALREPGFEQVAVTQYEYYLRTMRGAIDAIVETFGVTLDRPSEDIARYLVTIVDGLTLNWIVLGDAAQAERLLDDAAAHVAGLARPTCHSA